MSLRRRNINPTRRTAAPREEAPEITLDDLFPATRSPEVTESLARRAAAAATQRRGPRQTPQSIRCRAPRASTHAGPHGTPQEPVDVREVCERPMGDILDVVRSITRPARSDDYLHVSSLIYDCPRAIALREARGGGAPAQVLRLAEQLTYRQGEAIAEVIVKSVRNVAPTQIWGDWQCRCGHTRTQSPCLYSEATAASPCPHCGGMLDEYVEVPMFDEQYKIVGNPDLLLYLPEHDALQGVELKSITPNDFPDLARPQPEHLVQSLFYWWLMHRLGYRLTTTWSIVYVNKGHSFRGNPYKEFVIDAAAQVSRLEPLLEEAMALRAYREGGALPPRVRCNTPNDSKAKKCHECQACFSASAAAIRRRPVDLSAYSGDASSPEPSSPGEETAAPRVDPAPRRAHSGLVRASRVPGAPPVPVGHRPVSPVNRVRVPPRGR